MKKLNNCFRTSISLVQKLQPFVRPGLLFLLVHEILISFSKHVGWRKINPEGRHSFWGKKACYWQGDSCSVCPSSANLPSVLCSLKGGYLNSLFDEEFAFIWILFQNFIFSTVSCVGFSLSSSILWLGERKKPTHPLLWLNVFGHSPFLLTM